MPDADNPTRGAPDGLFGRARAGGGPEGLSPSKTAILEPDPFRFAKRLPWEKITIWVIFLLLLYFMRSFFGIIFLTFILSYIAATLVGWVSSKAGIGDKPDHPARYPITVGVFLAFLGFLAGAGYLVFPNLIEQGRLLVEQAQALIPRQKVLSFEERADAILLE
ncbi:MAG: hypothetical protein MUC63_07905, partial [Planctomycetes bacterium]|nr:hypothetical protein [Planctomycetota bacterium]